MRRPLERTAQARHGGLERVRTDLVVQAIERVLEDAARHDASLAAQELLQHARLAPPKRECGSVERGFARRRVQRERPRRQDRAESPAGPAKHRAAARHQFGGLHRLHHVVVRATIQPGQPVVETAAGGQHDHRGFAAPPPLGEESEPIAVGQAKVEEEEVVPAQRCKFPRLGGIGGVVDGKAGTAQCIGHRLGKRRVIFDKEKAQGSEPSRGDRREATGAGPSGRASWGVARARHQRQESRRSGTVAPSARTISRA